MKIALFGTNQLQFSKVYTPEVLAKLSEYGELSEKINRKNNTAVRIGIISRYEPLSASRAESFMREFICITKNKKSGDFTLPIIFYVLFGFILKDRLPLCIYQGMRTIRRLGA